MRVISDEYFEDIESISEFKSDKIIRIEYDYVVAYMKDIVDKSKYIDLEAIRKILDENNPCQLPIIKKQLIEIFKDVL